MAVPIRSEQSDSKRSLSKEEVTGRELFVQRCALCHLPIYPAPRKPIGPALDTYFKDRATAEREEAARVKISKGSSSMPGYQYTLTPEQIEGLIAYLKRTDDLSLYYPEHKEH